MIHWAIKAAKESIFSNKVYVSSDSGKILNLTKNGAIPIKRPKTLSGDNVFKIEAIKHANDLIEKKTKKKVV